YLQKHCADRLMVFLSHHRSQIPQAPILEIGCGTGYVTLPLLPLTIPRPARITDISALMVAYCRRKCITNDLLPSGIDFQVLDGEMVSEKNHYAAIVSGLTFQWFLNFRASFRRLIDALAPQGFLFFSIFSDQSFPEWKAMCRKLGFPFNGNRLPSIEWIEEAASEKGATLQLTREKKTISFPSSMDFFKSLKSIGASTLVHKNHLSSHQLKALVRHWDSESYPDVKSTYEIVYGVL